MRQLHWSVSSIVMSVGLPVAVALFCCGLPASQAHAAPQTITTYRLDSLDSLMLANLHPGRVVMLGEPVHGHSYYYRFLTGFLDAWLDSLEEDSPSHRLPTKLMLVLEMDQSQQDRLDRYFADGDITPVLTAQLDDAMRYPWGGLPTVDRFAFYSDLRDLILRIDAVNRDRADRIVLKIVGAEPPAPADYHTAAKMGWDEVLKENYNWFASTRDTLTAVTIRTRLEENPEYAVLVYYGNAHLQRGRRLKIGAPKPVAPQTGFYLVHYLDGALGRAKVICFQTWEDMSEGPRDCIRRPVAMDTLPEFEMFAGPVPKTPCSIGSVPSMRVMSWVLREIESGAGATDSVGAAWMSHLERTLYRELRYSYLARDSTAVADLDTLLHVGKYRASRLRHGNGDTRTIDHHFLEAAKKLVDRFDAVENIRRLDQWQDQLAKSREQPLSVLLSSLPPVAEGSESGQTSATARLREYLAINLLAVGTPDEQSKIIALLRESTGMEFKTAKEWREWWRGLYPEPPGPGR